MKFGFLFRKLIIEGNIYLQVVGKIKGKEIDDKMVEIIEGPYKNYKIQDGYTTAILTIDEKGIIDNSSSLALGFIPWDDIEEVCIKGNASNKFIELALKDEDKYLSSVNKIKRIFILAQKKMKHNVVCISLNIAGLDAEKAINYVQDVFKKYKK